MRLKVWMFSLYLGWLFTPSAAFGQAVGILPVIEDDETRLFLETLIHPFFNVWPAAPSIGFVIVNDSRFNAFVIDEHHIFVHTGLFEHLKQVDQLAAVLAHELGHIRGHHIVLRGIEQARLQKSQSLGLLLGVALGVGISPGFFWASTLIPSVSLSRFTAFSQAQEAMADQYGVMFLQQAGYNGGSMLGVMNVITDLQEGAAKQYWQVHPTGSWRRRRVALALGKDPVSQKNSQPSFQESFLRLRAKIRAYTGSVAAVRADYGIGDDLVARYGRAVLAFRQNEYAQALEAIQSLLSDYPRDPWFLEMKAAVLQKMNRFDDATASYEEALVIAGPSAYALKVETAAALLLSQRSDRWQKAEDLGLEAAWQDKTLGAWDVLLKVYIHRGDRINMALVRAKKAFEEGNISYARYQSGLVKKLASPSSSAWLHADDILAQLETAEAS